MAYLTREEFRALTTMPAVFVDQLEDVAPGWIEVQLESVSRWLDAQLRKRYASPFVDPVPPVVAAWLTAIVTRACYLKRGVDPTDLGFDEVKADAVAATEEVARAANAEHGLFDIPLRTNADGTAIRHGGPRVYSEASPYVWLDVQAETGRVEDRRRRGTHG